MQHFIANHLLKWYKWGLISCAFVMTSKARLHMSTWPTGSRDALLRWVPVSWLAAAHGGSRHLGPLWCADLWLAYEVCQTIYSRKQWRAKSWYVHVKLDNDVLNIRGKVWNFKKCRQTNQRLSDQRPTDLTLWTVSNIWATVIWSTSYLVLADFFLSVYWTMLFTFVTKTTLLLMHHIHRTGY